MEDVISVFGSFDQNLRMIETEYNVRVTDRDEQIRVSRLDAAFLLVWLAAALFRGCFLVRILRELLCRPEEPEKGVPE